MTSKKKALGRGLDAILQSPETDITTRDISGEFVAGAIANIPVAHIEANPFQPRTDFEEETLAELARSIKEQGIIQPITVRKAGYDKYQLISGERRLRAAQISGLRDIPAYIRVANDEQMLELALVENIHREDLNPIEIAISYQRLMEECNLTQENLSQKVSKDRATISNYIRLLKLPAEIQLALKRKAITMGHARALITLEDPGHQIGILVKILEKGLSVRDVEKAIRLLQEAPKVKDEKPQEQDDVLFRKEETLGNLLRAPVSIRRNTNGRGSVVINFTSDRDLQRILDLLNRS
jgi:ParB family chromosome partitioning protein